MSRKLDGISKLKLDLFMKNIIDLKVEHKLKHSELGFLSFHPQFQEICEKYDKLTLIEKQETLNYLKTDQNKAIEQLLISEDQFEEFSTANVITSSLNHQTEDDFEEFQTTQAPPPVVVVQQPPPQRKYDFFDEYIPSSQQSTDTLPKIGQINQPNQLQPTHMAVIQEQQPSTLQQINLSYGQPQQNIPVQVQSAKEKDMMDFDEPEEDEFEFYVAPVVTELNSVPAVAPSSIITPSKISDRLDLYSAFQDQIVQPISEAKQSDVLSHQQSQTQVQLSDSFNLTALPKDNYQILLSELKVDQQLQIPQPVQDNQEEEDDFEGFQEVPVQSQSISKYDLFEDPNKNNNEEKNQIQQKTEADNKIAQVESLTLPQPQNKYAFFEEIEIELQPSQFNINDDYNRQDNAPQRTTNQASQLEEDINTKAISDDEFDDFVDAEDQKKQLSVQEEEQSQQESSPPVISLNQSAPLDSEIAYQMEIQKIQEQEEELETQEQKKQEQVEEQQVVEQIQQKPGRRYESLLEDDEPVLNLDFKPVQTFQSAQVIDLMSLYGNPQPTEVQQPQIIVQQTDSFQQTLTLPSLLDQQFESISLGPQILIDQQNQLAQSNPQPQVQVDEFDDFTEFTEETQSRQVENHQISDKPQEQKLINTLNLFSPQEGNTPSNSQNNLEDLEFTQAQEAPIIQIQSNTHQQQDMEIKLISPIGTWRDDLERVIGLEGDFHLDMINEIKQLGIPQYESQILLYKTVIEELSELRYRKQEALNNEEYEALVVIRDKLKKKEDQALSLKAKMFQIRELVQLLKQRPLRVILGSESVTSILNQGKVKNPELEQKIEREVCKIAQIMEQFRHDFDQAEKKSISEDDRFVKFVQGAKLILQVAVRMGINILNLQQAIGQNIFDEVSLVEELILPFLKGQDQPRCSLTNTLLWGPKIQQNDKVFDAATYNLKYRL